ncbi:hypothetical protein CALVIDRAFT_398038 [Calocera viscosa TUFC12733]|uniref:Uncharacterized protein n=1 Tax=Calocera viscosa (strain TUFC12733) TaxID=1330018 RepID=A0A167PRQ9_CALVF|nr:hypothetical protein CALVIDRAFT_398038 [Calocera viscosa TUFC12733]
MIEIVDHPVGTNTFPFTSTPIKTITNEPTGRYDMGWLTGESWRLGGWWPGTRVRNIGKDSWTITSTRAYARTYRLCDCVSMQGALFGTPQN